MGFKTLIEGVNADLQDLYAVCADEINKRGIPNLEFDWRKEIRFGLGLFSGEKESALVLIAKDERHQGEVFAYSFGPNLYVETTAFWINAYEVDLAKEGNNWRHLDEVWTSCFMSLLDSAVRDALKRYLEKVQAPVPEGLTAKDVFIVD